MMETPRLKAKKGFSLSRSDLSFRPPSRNPEKRCASILDAGSVIPDLIRDRHDSLGKFGFKPVDFNQLTFESLVLQTRIFCFLQELLNAPLRERSFQRGSRIKSMIPLEVFGGDNVFHSLDPTIQAFIPPFHALDGRLSRVDIAVIEIPLPVALKRDDRFRFHQESGGEINGSHGPKP
jgi:hypothetical protein